MSELPRTREYQAHSRGIHSHPRSELHEGHVAACDLADAMRDELLARIAEMEADVTLARTALVCYGEDDPDCIREADQHLRHALGLSTSRNPLADVRAVSIETVSHGPDRQFEYRPSTRAEEGGWDDKP